ncbi:hypothetical protein KTAU_27500, partial [Thermogemmatispora aurantia]
RGGVRQDSL